MCKVSVIMGVHNGQQFLREAIDSVLAQTFCDFELLICDDGSTDTTSEILQEYVKRDPRVRVLTNQVNIGLAASLNRCIDQAKGTYLARMDADDRCAHDRFAVQVAFLDNHPEVSVVGTSAFFMDDNSVVFGQRACDVERRISLADAVKAAQLIHPTVMMRTDAVRSVHGYSVNDLTTRAEDYDLWCKLCEKNAELVLLPQKLLYYREDTANISRRKYRYRIQEAKLKYYWICRTGMPVSYLFFAVKPLIVGLIPLNLYRVLHKKQVQPLSAEEECT